jgi:hypothetical protein
MKANHAQPKTRAIGHSHELFSAREASRASLKFVVTRKDMHPGVYKLALVCWLLLLGIFWVTFSGSTAALFMVTVGTFYAAVFFGVPFLMSRIGGFSSHSPLPLVDFTEGAFDTIDGPIGGGEALLQVILVPLALGIGGVAIGFIIHFARIAH